MREGANKMCYVGNNTYESVHGHTAGIDVLKRSTNLRLRFEHIDTEYTPCGQQLRLAYSKYSHQITDKLLRNI